MKETIYRSMNWPLLRRQKKELIEVAENGHSNLHGIVYLIDVIQDYAVDYLGIPEKIVFNFNEEE